MGRNERGYFDLLIYSVGFWLALTMALNSNKAWSGAWEAGGPVQKAPRWSNDDHITGSAAVPAGCAETGSGKGADYIPGADAWGRPVAPADGHTGFVNSLPVEIDIDLGSRRLGGHDVNVETGTMAYDAGQNTLNGYPLSRDCTSYFK